MAMGNNGNFYCAASVPYNPKNNDLNIWPAVENGGMRHKHGNGASNDLKNFIIAYCNGGAMCETINTNWNWNTS